MDRLEYLDMDVREDTTRGISPPKTCLAGLLHGTADSGWIERNVP